MKNIFVVLGKSGCGKSTVVDLLCERLNLSNIVLTTTRPRRDGEVDGVDYHFISDQCYMQSVIDNLFVQYTNFRGWGYGIEKSSLNSCINNNLITVLSPEGYKQLCGNVANDFNIIPVYIHCDDRTRLQRSLERDTDVDEIVRRYQADKNDFIGVVEHVVLSNGIVINNSCSSLDYAVNTLEKSIEEYLSSSYVNK